jgi:zinc protease
MKKIHILASLIFLATALSAAAPDVHAPGKVVLPPSSEIRLPNGARIILMEKHDVPLVSFAARMRGGAVTNSAGKAGTASLLADLLQKGAGKRNAQQFAQAVDEVGGDLNADSGRESIIISGEFLSRDRNLMIGLLKDMLEEPRLASDEFAKVKERAIQTIAAEKDSDPFELVGPYFSSFLFGAHPYGQPVDGSEASLSRIELGDVTSYYHQQFGGDRLVLAIVGDFDAKEMTGAVRAAFGSWKPAPGAIPTVAAASPATSRRVLLVDKPDATQTYFWIGNVGISRTDPRRVGVDVANTVFGGRFTSILTTELRTKSGLTYAADSSFFRFTRPGIVAIQSFTKTESTAKAVDMALDLLDRFRNTGIAPDALTSARSYILGQFPPELETSKQIASRLAELSFYGLDRSEIEGYAAAVNAASERELNPLIKDAFPDPAHLVFVFIGNASAIRDVVAKYGPLTEMKITDKEFEVATK